MIGFEGEERVPGFGMINFNVCFYLAHNITCVVDYLGCKTGVPTEVYDWFGLGDTSIRH